MTAALAVALVLWVGQSPSWAASLAPPRAEAESTVAVAAVDSVHGQPSPQDQSYAAREAQAQGLEKFKGGDVVIVGSAGLIIVLLLILIIVEI